MKSSIIFFVFVILTSRKLVSSFQTLIDHGIYSFLNRHDNQYLNAINLKIPNPMIVIDDWREASTQKWRAVNAYTVTAAQLKPTSDEERVMKVDWKSDGNLVSQDYAGFGFSNSQYWQVNSAGGGFSQVRNYQTGTCLQSFGMGKQVGLGACDNSFRQQWKMNAI